MIPNDQPLPSAGGSYLRDPESGALTEILPGDDGPDETAKVPPAEEAKADPAPKARKQNAKET